MPAEAPRRALHGPLSAMAVPGDQARGGAPVACRVPGRRLAGTSVHRRLAAGSPACQAGPPVGAAGRHLSAFSAAIDDDRCGLSCLSPDTPTRNTGNHVLPPAGNPRRAGHADPRRRDSMSQSCQRIAPHLTQNPDDVAVLPVNAIGARCAIHASGFVRRACRRNIGTIYPQPQPPTARGIIPAFRMAGGAGCAGAWAGRCACVGRGNGRLPGADLPLAGSGPLRGPWRTRVVCGLVPSALPACNRAEGRLSGDRKGTRVPSALMPAMPCWPA